MSYQNVITFFKLKNAQEVLILFFKLFSFFYYRNLYFNLCTDTRFMGGSKEFLNYKKIERGGFKRFDLYILSLL